MDAPVSIGAWPKNYDDYLGAVSAGAPAQSRNTVAVKISEQTGLLRVIWLAFGHYVADALFGFRAFEVSLLELTAAYTHFANGGRQTMPHVISTVLTGSGALYRRTASVPLQIVTPRHIGTLNAMLRSVMQNGTGQRRHSGAGCGGKTGTSQNWRDAWFVGYSGALVVGGWVGNDDNGAMDRVSGGGLPAAIWHRFMTGQKHLSADLTLPGGTLPEGDTQGLLRRLFGF